MSQRLRGGDGARIVAFSVAFVLVGYLSYRQGGYDDVVRGHAAILVLWIVAVGCAFAVLPRTGMSGLGWAAVALMTGWGIWTAVGLIWTESPEATFNEVGRIAGLLGILMLALAMQGPGSARAVVHGAGGAIAVVAVVSVASRLYPSWFPVSDSITTLPGASRRLSFPLGYWNGLAALMAAGVPLLLAPATAGRTTAGRAAAGCALPIAAVCLVLTLSRGGAVAAAAALGVFVLLTAHRARALAVIGVAAVGTLIVVRLVLSHHDLEVGARTGDVAGHGTSVALVLLLAALAAGAVAALAPRVARGDSGEVGVDGPSDRRRTIRLVTVAAGVMVAALLLAAATGMLSSAWNSFQRPSIQGAAAFDASRLGSATGTGRYQFWGAALDAFGTHPFRGIGAGSYEFWWSRNAPFYLPVRNAHSLYLESLAELGVFGLVAVAFVVLIVVAAVARAIGASVREAPGRAAVAAGITAIAVAAALDWVWQMTVLPALFLLLGATALAPAVARSVTVSQRVLLGVLALVSIVAVAVPLATSSLLADSRAGVRAGRLAEALVDARSAQRVEPSASSPRLQAALIEEQQGALAAAEKDAAAAAAASPTDWRLWVVLARIQSQRGHRRAALASFGRARALNPQSPLLQPSPATLLGPAP